MFVLRGTRPEMALGLRLVRSNHFFLGESLILIVRKQLCVTWKRTSRLCVWAQGCSFFCVSQASLFIFTLYLAALDESLFWGLLFPSMGSENDYTVLLCVWRVLSFRDADLLFKKKKLFNIYLLFSAWLKLRSVIGTAVRICRSTAFICAENSSSWFNNTGMRSFSSCHPNAFFLYFFSFFFEGGNIM